MDILLIVALLPITGVVIGWIFGVRSEHADNQIGRVEFLKWYCVLTIIPAILEESYTLFVTQLFEPHFYFEFVFLSILASVVSFAQAKIFVRRLHDMDCNRNASYLNLLPFLNICLVGILIFKAGVEPGPPTHNDTA